MSLIAQSSGIPSTSFSKEDLAYSVTALFDSRDHAEAARQDLIAAGIHADAVNLLADAPGAEIDDPTVGGVWQTLKDLFMPEQDRDQYAEGIRRGGATLCVRTDTANHDRVVALLDRDGAVDLDERREQWRNDGWTGYTGRDPLVEARSPALATHADTEDMGYAAASDGTAGFGVSNVDRLAFDEDGAPPIESPGALPPTALEARPEAPPADADTVISRKDQDSEGRTPRVRSYPWTTNQPISPDH